MNEERRAELHQALERILLTLAAEYQPEQVILFGSMAQAVVADRNPFILEEALRKGKVLYEYQSVATVV